MTNAMTPVFEMQRTMIKQNKKAFDDTVHAQKSVFGTMVDGFEANQQFNERNAEMTRSALHAYIDAVENSLPEGADDFDQYREIIDETFDTVEESQADAWASAIEAIHESSEAYEEFADSYVDAVDSSFDAFLENHERLEASFDETAETIEVQAD